MVFSLPQLSPDNYFIGQNYPDGPPNFLGPEDVGSIFDQELLSPTHTGGTKTSTIRKNEETASKELQIW